MWIQSAFFGFDELWSQIEFRLLMAYEVVAAPRWNLEIETLAQNELLLIRRGLCHVQSGTRRALAKSGDAIFLRGGEYRITTEADGAPLDIIGFGFRAHLLGTLDLLALLDAPLCFPSSNTSLQTYLENLTREGRDTKIGYGLATTAFAQLALVEALRAANSFGQNDSHRVLDSGGEDLETRVLHRLQSAQNGDIAQALQIVASRFQEPLDVAQIAKSLHLSAPHFSRKFKAALGMAPVEYLRVYRLRQARAMLSQSDDAISQVAHRCGFQDSAYFSRAFKTQFGSSPQEFRRYLRALSK